MLVYYELHGDMVSAITREKQIKKWNRSWKLELIEEQNPEWQDLWEQIIYCKTDKQKSWIPAFAGMTILDLLRSLIVLN